MEAEESALDVVAEEDADITTAEKDGMAGVAMEKEVAAVAVAEDDLVAVDVAVVADADAPVDEMNLFRTDTIQLRNMMPSVMKVGPRSIDYVKGGTPAVASPPQLLRLHNKLNSGQSKLLPKHLLHRIVQSQQ